MHLHTCVKREREAQERAVLRSRLTQAELAAAAAVSAGGQLATDDAAEAVMGAGEDAGQARRYAVRYKELMDTAATVRRNIGSEAIICGLRYVGTLEARP
eukprot:357062-Chlamydomonas_euryale.AAC.5